MNSPPANPPGPPPPAPPATRKTEERLSSSEGIAPDILVQRAKVTAYDTSSRVTEADLSGHLDNANGHSEADKEDKAEVSRKAATELLSRDNQLYEALTLLKGLNILGMRDQQLQEKNTGES